MPPLKRIIIDGNNLIYRDAELATVARRNFEQARHRLVLKLEEVAGALGYDRITVVFDGRRAALTLEQRSSGVEVAFAPANLTADSVIERLAHDPEWPGNVLVVTSDRGERDTVEAQGVTTVGCSNFLASLADCRKRLATSVRSLRTPASGSRLGDFFPPPPGGRE